MITLNYGDIVILENRIYQVYKSQYADRKTGKGIMARLKLLTNQELNNLILKGGLKE